MTIYNVTKEQRSLEDFNNRLLEIRNSIKSMQHEYGLDLENLSVAMDLSDPHENFIYQELGMIMYHLNDSLEDITYLNRPIIVEGQPQFSESKQDLLVNGHLVSIKEPVEVKLEDENVWFKTWIVRLKDDFGFTAFLSNTSPAQMQTISSIQCIIRLRDCHK